MVNKNFFEKKIKIAGLISKSHKFHNASGTWGLLYFSDGPGDFFEVSNAR